MDLSNGNSSTDEDFASDSDTDSSSHPPRRKSEAYPYHPPREDEDRYQVHVPPSIELSKKRQRATHADPKLVWNSKKLHRAEVDTFITFVKGFCHFEVEDSHSLAFLAQCEYNIADARVKLMAQYPSDQNAVVPFAKHYDWANIWMRKAIECGADATELQSGIEVLQAASSDEDVDPDLLARCCQLLKEWSEQEKEFLSAIKNPLIAMSRLRKLVARYQTAGSISVGSLEAASDALHLAMLFRRRMASVTDLDQLKSKDHDMSFDEATRWLAALNDRAPFLGHPSITALKQAVQQTTAILEQSRKTSPPPPFLLTPLTLSEEMYHGTALLHSQWKDMISRRGPERGKLSQLLTLAEGIHGAQIVLNRIEQQRIGIKRRIDSFNTINGRMTQAQCFEILQDCARDICVITPEESAMQLQYDNTANLLDKITAAFQRHGKGEVLDVNLIIALHRALNGPNLTRITWTGNQQSCPISWLKKQKEFANFAEKQSLLATPETASALLQSLKAAKLNMKEVQSRCESLIATRSTPITVGKAIEVINSNEAMDLDRAILWIQNMKKHRTVIPDMDRLVQSVQAAIDVRKQLRDMQSSARAGTARPPLAQFILEVDAYEQLSVPKKFTFPELVQTRSDIRQCQAWAEKIPVLLSDPKNDVAVRRHIRDAAHLKCGVVDLLTSLHDRVWENEWLKNAGSVSTLDRQIQLVAEAEGKLSPRIKETFNVLLTRVNVGKAWVQEIRNLILPYYHRSERPYILSSGQINGGAGLGPQLNCFCRRPSLPDVKCQQCNMNLHLNCLGLPSNLSVQALASYICPNCAAHLYNIEYARNFPPSVLPYPIPGPSLAELRKKKATLPFALRCPERDWFIQFVDVALEWTSKVQAALKVPSPNKYDLIQLYIEGEAIRVDIPERHQLIKLIKEIRAGALQPRSAPKPSLSRNSSSSALSIASDVVTAPLPVSISEPVLDPLNTSLSTPLATEQS